MASRISGLQIIEIGTPLLGSKHPSFVKAELTIDLSNVSNEMVEEWDSLREGEALYIVQFKPLTLVSEIQKINFDMKYAKDCAKQIRGCTIEGIYDENMTLIDNSLGPNLSKKPKYYNKTRSFLVKFDTYQFYLDFGQIKQLDNYDKIYGEYNIVLR
ncbi:MAG: hypothetical protein MHPSP_002430, partial [Paramarteilia canceri]